MTISSLVTTIAIVLSSLSSTTTPQAQILTPEPVLVATSTPSQIIELYASEYDVDASMMISIAKCESSLRHEGIYGDGGKAYGIFQFHKPTFEEMKRKAKMPDLEYTDQDDQVNLASWAIANKLGSHWTCWRKYQASQKKSD